MSAKSTTRQDAIEAIGGLSKDARSILYQLAEETDYLERKVYQVPVNIKAAAAEDYVLADHMFQVAIKAVSPQ